MTFATQDGSHGILLESGTNEVEFLEFYLGPGRYGVNVAKVNQVVVFDEVPVAELPGNTQAGVLGTTMFRGDPILVIDLAETLNTTVLDEDEGEKNRKLLLVLEFNGRTTGFVVDRVNAIRRVSWEDFKQGDDVSMGADHQFVTGIVSVKDQMTLVLDFEALLGNIIPSVSPVNYQDGIKPLEVAQENDITIVYCEDSEIVQKVVIEGFRQAGIEDVRIFHSGKDGLEYLRSCKPGEIDLLVTDIEMPLMDGLTLCKQLKSDPRWSYLPVVFFSSTINDQMRRKCESVGGAASYSKPEINVLVAELGEILSKNAKQS